MSRWEWLDFDESESKQIRDFLSHEVDGEGVDPLRIGASVRDRIADKLFPGTSTQYTRLRYVFLAAAMLRKKGATIAGLKQSQYMLNTELDKANPNEKGVIGKRTKSRDFVRLYWTAVRTWKLLTPVTGDERDLTVENGIAAFQSTPATDEEGNTLVEQRVRWDPAVVKISNAFWDNQAKKKSGWSSIYCTKAEVNFILDQWLVLRDKPALAAIAAQLRKGKSVYKPKYPWNVSVGDYQQARVELDRAKAVSLICWAAQLAYNFALINEARRLQDQGAECTWQQKNNKLDVLEKKISGLFDEWRAAFDAEHSLLAPWTSTAHWKDLGSGGSQPFLAGTARMLCDGKTNLRSAEWASWVKAREKVNPAPKLGNPAHLATWSGTSEMAQRWDFRWGASVQRFIQDAESPHG